MNRTFLAWTRTIHIYLTMAAMALMVFFALTGITANHEEWFGATTPMERKMSGVTPKEALDIEKPDKLRVVEHLRANFQVTGAMVSFENDDKELVTVIFKAPGRNCKAEINRADGKTEVTITTFGIFGRINDLHRARDTGETWRLMVDLSAITIILAAITGVILWLALPKRRKLGIVATVLGTGVCVVFYFLVVP
jgi:hypothetical protein